MNFSNSVGAPNTVLLILKVKYTQEGKVIINIRVSYNIMMKQTTIQATELSTCHEKNYSAVCT